jgi:hypothetical protein
VFNFFNPVPIKLSRVAEGLNRLLREFLTSRNCSVRLVNVEIEGSRGDTTLTSRTERYNGGGNSRSRKLDSFASANSGRIATLEIFLRQGGSARGSGFLNTWKKARFSSPARAAKVLRCFASGASRRKGVGVRRSAAGAKARKSLAQFTVASLFSRTADCPAAIQSSAFQFPEFAFPKDCSKNRRRHSFGCSPRAFQLNQRWELPRHSPD